MREIIFRGKYYRTGEWVYGIPVKESLIGSDDAYFPQIIPERNGIHRSIDRVSVVEETIGQYTGLTDKNGARIFEGDILQNYTKTRTFIVEWSESCGMFALKEINDNDSDFCDYDGFELVIVGNVFDNPDLIGGAE